jgi:dihydropteroate synthase
MIWRSRHKSLSPGKRALVMGILNVTPDSFSDGGRHDQLETALNHARRMIDEGAAILDIGGESTRPGSLPVPEDEEIRRVVPVIGRLRAHWDGWISVDTAKAAVADAALHAGADIVNDVSGLRADPEMAAVCARHQCAVVVMHMQGEPRTMQVAPRYEDVVREVREFFAERMDALEKAGIARESLCFDPGIGFGKTLDHNLALLRSLDTLAPEGRPLLLGVSRKSFIGMLLGDMNLDLRDWPTVAITARARGMGVMLHRVHEVRANVEALQMTEAILDGTVSAES